MPIVENAEDILIACFDNIHTNDKYRVLDARMILNLFNTFKKGVSEQFSESFSEFFFELIEALTRYNDAYELVDSKMWENYKAFNITGLQEQNILNAAITHLHKVVKRTPYTIVKEKNGEIRGNYFTLSKDAKCLYSEN